MHKGLKIKGNAAGSTHRRSGHCDFAAHSEMGASSFAVELEEVSRGVGHLHLRAPTFKCKHK